VPRFLGNPRVYCLGSQREGVGGFRVEVAALTGAETIEGAKDQLIRDGDRDADANVGAEALGGDWLGVRTTLPASKKK
jgi:hypothetical protein